MKRIIYFLATILVVAIIASACTKEYDEYEPRDKPIVLEKSAIEFGVTNGPTNGSQKSMATGNSMKAVQIWGDGDSLRILPNVTNVFFIVNPNPLWTYTWSFCGTIYVGTEASIKFPTVDITCTLTVSAVITASGLVATPPMTALLFITNNLIPPTEQIKSYTSVRNSDFSWTYTIIGSTHTVDTLAAGLYFSTGDHTSWANQYTAVYAPGTITFTVKTYNNEFKVQYGKGTIYSDATGSKYHSLSAVDNTYQLVFDEGVIYIHGHSINTTAPGTTGDFGISAAIRMTVASGNVTFFCNIKDYIPGAKTNPYFQYRASGTTTWTTIPLVYVNGNGWGGATMTIASLPVGPGTLEFLPGADGGTATAPGSGFWNTLKLLFEVSLIGL